MRATFGQLSSISFSKHHLQHQERQRGKSTIGISMSSGMVKKQAELSISHALSQHWSVNGRTSIALSIFIDGFEQEEEITEEKTEKKEKRGFFGLFNRHS